MWAIIRLVVVLPLVPVTATTGTRGVIVRGRRARLGGGHPRGGRADSVVESPPGTASSTSATARPISWARSRRRHGKATTIWCGSLVGRTRTASRAVPHSWATARTSRADGPGREPLPEPGLRRPRPRVRQPDPAGEPDRRSSVAAASALMSSGQLDRGAREVEVRALQDPELDQ